MAIRPRRSGKPRKPQKKCPAAAVDGPRPPQCSPQHQRSAALIRARPSLPVAPPVPAAPADAPFPAPAAKHASRHATPRHIHRLRHTLCTSASTMPVAPSPFIFQGRAVPKAASASPVALRFPQPLPAVRPTTDPPAVPQPHSRFACNPALSAFASAEPSTESATEIISFAARKHTWFTLPPLCFLSRYKSALFSKR